MTINLSQKFDLEDYDLSHLFIEVASYLDGENLDEEKSKKINCLSDILKNKSRDFRIGKENPYEDLFFWKFYGEKKEEANRDKLKELCAGRLLTISEELSMIKDLPKKKVEELGDICLRFSKETLDYWNFNHPNGFKRY